jgi:ribosomal protein S18 acetylase RimI-like enzyme
VFRKKSALGYRTSSPGVQFKNVKYRAENPTIDQFYPLFESTGWNQKYGLTKDELRSILKNNFFSVSCYLDDELVGYGRVMSDGVLHAMIYEMIVKPEHQRKGIGSEMMRSLLKRCQENNIRDIQLFCARGKSEFYERFGFRARPDDAPGMELKGHEPLGRES